MNSKLQNLLTQWKVASICTEKQIEQLAYSLSEHLYPGDRIILEGPMGVGKSTFARFLILGLGSLQPPAGSPTFALAHEYSTPKGDVVHLDFYRIQSESEIQEAGIAAYYWETPKIVISEWISEWPDFYKNIVKNRYLESSCILQVQLAWDPFDQSQRLLSLDCLET